MPEPHGSHYSFGNGRSSSRPRQGGYRYEAPTDDRAGGGLVCHRSRTIRFCAAGALAWPWLAWWLWWFWTGLRRSGDHRQRAGCSVLRLRAVLRLLRLAPPTLALWAALAPWLRLVAMASLAAASLAPLALASLAPLAPLVTKRDAARQVVAIRDRRANYSLRRISAENRERDPGKRES